MKRPKSFVSYNHMNCCLPKMTHINLHTLYITQIKTSSRIQDYQNTSSTSKVTNKTILIILFNLFTTCNTFECKVTQIFR